ncbi:unnamed protein product [Adineta steineri]|uniref:Uncharacterized protein n=1 Tax=Adineta steineri TaxID=433720 RepID=A0A814QVT7_9BILA|nr:unnamed protein product [Adineta steineri]CAF3957402.1 unnamed protein product [Adineta steineri]
MFIRLFLVCLHLVIGQILASCPYIRTSVVLSECVFDSNLYISLGANILNSNSINFIGYYSLGQKNNISNTLIYNLGNRWMLLVPLLIKCAHQPINLTFTECQYTMRQNKNPNQFLSTAEYMTTQSSVMNITDLGMQSVLFLQPGEISLRSCKAYDCSQELVYLTASNETFNLKINYEKSINTKCQYDEDCQHSYSVKDLIRCDKLTQTCQCYHDNISTIDISGIGRICTDSIDQSNCTKFPRRCLRWCDESETSYCLCPKLTRKVRKINGVFDCELEPTGQCQFDDDQIIGSNIRKCPTGTYCDGERCRPSTISRQIHDDDEYFLSSTIMTSTATTSFDNILSSTHKQISPLNQTTVFIRTLIFITIAIILFFILIILIIIILIRSHRIHASTTPCEDKVSSSSFAQSTSTALSSDSSTNINYHRQSKQQEQQPISTVTSVSYENILTKSTFVRGLVPETNLSPRFHRQQQTLDEKRRIPLQIRSPSLTRINPFIDHASLTTTNEHSNKKRATIPKVTCLQNGDIIISA